MMSQATILFNYRKAIQQAQNLDELARRLENLAKNDMEGTLQSVARSWRGDSANAFLAKGHKAENDMLASARQLHNVASAIRKAAENVRRAEERARQIALIMAGRK